MRKDTLILSGLNIHTENLEPHVEALAINNKRIVALGAKSALRQQFPEAIEHAFPSSYHLLPGFIDLHTHGANGADVMDATFPSLENISQTLAKEGTTSFLATTMTASLTDITRALKNVYEYILRASSVKGAAVLGVHLEGPFLSPKKAGAQQAVFLQNPDISQFKEWQKAAHEWIKLVTLAPELPGSLDCIPFLKSEGVVVSMGHSEATYGESVAAIQAGCHYATHLFNAMRHIHHREPGIAAAVLLNKEVTAELILDGVHLHPAMVDLAFRMKGAQKITLVTDAMRAKCLQNGVYDLGGQKVQVKNEEARLADGSLAGSVLAMNKALKNVFTYTSCTLQEAIQMVSENPARVLGLFSERGSIAINKLADLVVLNKDWDVVTTICQGEIVYG